MLDVDPRFRIANQTENELLKEEVLDDILEEEYGIEDKYISLNSLIAIRVTVVTMIYNV